MTKVGELLHELPGMGIEFLVSCPPGFNAFRGFLWEQRRFGDMMHHRSFPKREFMGWHLRGDSQLQMGNNEVVNLRWPQGIMIKVDFMTTHQRHFTKSPDELCV